MPQSSPGDATTSTPALAGYAAALRGFVEGGGEVQLQRGFELARRAMGEGVGLTDLARAHRRALEDLRLAPQPNPLAARAEEFFAECLAPFEMAHHGYREAILQLRAKHDELERANEALVAADREKDELAALIVHDLKNPLTGVLSNLQFVRGEPEGGPEAREALADALTSAQRMGRILGDLLDIYRGKERGLVVRPREVDLVALVQEMRRGVLRRAEDRRQVVEVIVPEGGCVVRADGELLARLLENLVDNAVKYSARAATIQLVVSARPGETLLEVRDRGPGIPAEAKEPIFERFVRLEPDRVHGMSYGLGLVFCRLAAEAHGGRIWVEDNPGGGSRFKVALPDRRREQEES